MGIIHVLNSVSLHFSSESAKPPWFIVSQPALVMGLSSFQSDLVSRFWIFCLSRSQLPWANLLFMLGVLVCSNNNKMLQNGWLQRQKFAVSQLGGWKSETEALAELVSPKASLLGVQMDVFLPFSLCGLFSVCVLQWLSYEDTSQFRSGPTVTDSF